MKKFPLYSGTSQGKSYDGSIEYEMVIITKWTDITENAKEEKHKTYYFKSRPFMNLDRYIKNEKWCKYIFENFKNYERLEIIKNIFEESVIICHTKVKR